MTQNERGESGPGVDWSGVDSSGAARIGGSSTASSGLTAAAAFSTGGQQGSKINTQLICMTSPQHWQGARHLGSPHDPPSSSKQYQLPFHDGKLVQLHKRPKVKAAGF